MRFYLGLGMQLIGFTMVGLCLFYGLNAGDYGQLQLVQLVAGSLLFYLGQYLKSR